jgi:ribosome maturation factor RimP
LVGDETPNVESVDQIEAAIAPALAAMGYEVVRVRFSGGNQPVLQVMIERADRGALSVEDCAAASRTVSALLDVEDVATDAYTLEVSSPGIDRPLVRLDDFDRFSGFEAKVEMTEPLEGRRRFRGRLLGAEDGCVRIAVDDNAVSLPHAAILRAKLVLTDELIAATEAEERV